MIKLVIINSKKDYSLVLFHIFCYNLNRIREG